MIIWSNPWVYSFFYSNPVHTNLHSIVRSLKESLCSLLSMPWVKLEIYCYGLCFLILNSWIVLRYLTNISVMRSWAKSPHIKIFPFPQTFTVHFGSVIIIIIILGHFLQARRKCNSKFRYLNLEPSAAKARSLSSWLHLFPPSCCQVCSIQWPDLEPK